MVTDLTLVSVLKDTGFVMMGKHANVSYCSATQIFITYIEEIHQVGFDWLNIAIQCHLNAQGFQKFTLSPLVSYLPVVCQYPGYSRASIVALDIYF